MQPGPFRFDVACLQETWLGDKDKLSLSGFQTFRQDRLSDRIGRGTAVLCRSSLDLSFLQLSWLGQLGFEASLIVVNKLSFYDKHLVVNSIYKPPNTIIEKNN